MAETLQQRAQVMRRPDFSVISVHMVLPFFAAVLFLGGCSSAPLATPGGQIAKLEARNSKVDLRISPSRGEKKFLHPVVGLAVDYPEEENPTRDRIRADFELLRKMGIRHLRVGLGWDSIEAEPGVYDWHHWDAFFEEAQRAGITVVPYVCYTPEWLGEDPWNFWREPPSDLSRFGHFMRQAVQRYRGKVHTWELWNEPDNQWYWLGTPEQYAHMIADASRQIREVAPDVRLVLGGMSLGWSPFLEELLQKHRIHAAVDVINVHGYLETWDNERAEQYRYRLEDVRHHSNLAGAGDLKIWMAEFGYSSYRHSPKWVSEYGVRAVYDYEHTAGYQAVALWKHHLLLAATEAVSLMAWYRLYDLPDGSPVIGDANNRHLGILSVAGAPKPAFHALKSYVKLFDEPFRRQREELELDAGADFDRVVFVFEEKDGDLIVAGWLRSSRPEEVSDDSGMAADTRRETVRVPLPRGKFGAPQAYRISAASAGKAVPEDDVTLRGTELVGVELTGDSVFFAEIQRKDQLTQLASERSSSPSRPRFRSARR